MVKTTKPTPCPHLLHSIYNPSSSVSPPSYTFISHKSFSVFLASVIPPPLTSFTPRHSLVLTHHSQTSLLSHFVSYSSASVSADRYQNHIWALWLCCCCLHFRITSWKCLHLPILFPRKLRSPLSLLEN